MTINYEFFLNVLVAVLLLATIVYAALLNRRLGELRSHRAELEGLINAFNESCARAEQGVQKLRTATDEAVRLQQYLERSQGLREDLAYLLDRGSSVADRLDGNVRQARASEKTTDAGSRDGGPRLASVGNAASAPAAAAPSEAPRPRSLLRAARAEAPADNVEDLADRVAERAAEHVAARAIDRTSLRDRSSMRAAAGAGEAAPEAAAAAGGGLRSKAERDLMNALRARR